MSFDFYRICPLYGKVKMYVQANCIQLIHVGMCLLDSSFDTIRRYLNTVVEAASHFNFTGCGRQDYQPLLKKEYTKKSRISTLLPFREDVTALGVSFQTRHPR